MRLRARIWPGPRTRGIGSRSASRSSAPWPSAPAGRPATAARCRSGFRSLPARCLRPAADPAPPGPVVPFLLSALLSVLSPAINGALTPLPTRLVATTAAGRPDHRRGHRVLVVARPWDGGPAATRSAAGSAAPSWCCSPGRVGIYVRTRAQLLAALRERAERAEAEQELLARDAVLTERTRIAREMHDAVGHRVSLMVLQAGAIEMAAADPQRVEQLAGQVQTAGPPGARRAAADGRRPARRRRRGRAARPAARPRRRCPPRGGVAAGRHGRRPRPGCPTAPPSTRR